MRLNSLRYDARDWLSDKLSSLSDGLRWSTLARFGQSLIAKFTILVPFIGYLIIFNIHVKPWLETTPVTARFYYLYFGLLLLGIGSTVYAILAPTQVKLHPLPADYIRYMDTLATDNLVRASLDNVIGLFLKYNNEEQRSSMFDGEPLSFPARISTIFHSFIKVFVANASAADPDLLTNSEPPIDSDDNLRLLTGSGNLMTDNVVLRMYENRRMDVHFVESMYGSAIHLKRDIFYLEHSALDYSNFIGRMTVAALYGIGFTLLFIPTVITTLHIIDLGFD